MEEWRLPAPSVFQSGVSSWPSWGVHPQLHSGAKEGCPERHYLPLPDSWSTGIPPGATHSCFLIDGVMHSCILLPRLYFLHPFSFLPFISPFAYSFRLSSFFCIVNHFSLRFIFSLDTFSFHSPFLFPLIPCVFCPLFISHRIPSLSCSPSLHFSSLHHHLLLSHLIHLHCFSCVFHDEALESLWVPIITMSRGQI